MSGEVPEYFTKLAKEPKMRLQQPRSTLKNPMARETCRTGFPVAAMKKSLLLSGALEGKYVFVYEQPAGAAEFYLMKLTTLYIPVSNVTPQESTILMNSLNAGIPYLGLVKVEVGGDVNHMLAFVVLKNAVASPYSHTLYLFETYDTSKTFMGDSDGWIDRITKKVTESAKLSPGSMNYKRVVPPGIDLQEYDDASKARCVMWALVFLKKISSLPNLKAATMEDFQKIYAELNLHNGSAKAYSAYIEGIVYGAKGGRRRKTRRTRKTRKTVRSNP
jgi:hypothetical protein